MGDVIDLDPGPAAGTCPDCGGSWWMTDGITIDADGAATGYALPLRCMTCTTGGDLTSLPTHADDEQHDTKEDDRG